MYRKLFFTILLTSAVFLAGNIAALAQTAPVRGEVKLKKADGTMVPVADAVVAGIREIDVAFPVQGDASRQVEDGVGREPAVAEGACRTVSGDCRDDPSSTIHFTDAVVEPVRDVEGARKIHFHVPRC